jgi:hypothetical protein
MVKVKKEAKIESKTSFAGRISIQKAFETKAGEKVKLAGWVHDTDCCVYWRNSPRIF